MNAWTKAFNTLSNLFMTYLYHNGTIAIEAEKVGKKLLSAENRALARRYAALAVILLALCLVFSLFAIKAMYSGLPNMAVGFILAAMVTLILGFAMIGFAGEALVWSVFAIMLAKNVFVDPQIWGWQTIAKILQDVLILARDTAFVIVRTASAYMPGVTVPEMETAWQVPEKPQSEIEPLLKSAEATLKKMQARAEGYAHFLKKIFQTYLFSCICLLLLNMFLRFGTHDTTEPFGWAVSWLNSPLAPTIALLIVIVGMYSALNPEVKKLQEVK